MISTITFINQPQVKKGAISHQDIRFIKTLRASFYLKFPHFRLGLLQLPNEFQRFSEIQAKGVWKIWLHPRRLLLDDVPGLYLLPTRKAGQGGLRNPPPLGRSALPAVGKCFHTGEEGSPRTLALGKEWIIAQTVF